MNINGIYGGDWLRAEDLQDQWPLDVTVADWELVEFEDDKTGKTRKQVALTFIGREKRLGLNKTNANRIAELHGPEIANWVGKTITLVVERVEAFGKLMDAIRVQYEQPAQSIEQSAENATTGDDIPW